MPIEIKELVIRTVVGPGDGAGSPGYADSGLVAAGGQPASTEEIVQECVRQVLRVLKMHRER